MVVFKKPTKPGAAAPSQQQQQQTSEQTATRGTIAPTPTTTHQEVAKPPSAPMRYSDVIAKRKSTHNITSINKLLETFELCEQVLDYLPMKEVLLATRVCRAFKTNIENSSRLQAKLYFAPDLTIKRTALSANGTLLAGRKAEQCINAVEAAGQAERREYGEIVLYVAHPALKVGRISDRYKRMGMVKYATVLRQANQLYFNEDLTFRDPALLCALPETSSLNRMLLTQPPIKKAIVYNEFLKRATTIHRETGVTIGDIITTTRAVVSLEDLRSQPVYVNFQDAFVVNSRARSVVEMAGELSLEDDPTRWVSKGNDYELQAGGFAFV